MKCPVDGTTLLLAERQEIEIDYCPECRGVWLDRGELDKLVRRSDDRDRDRNNDRDRYDDRSRAREPEHDSRKRKKKGWLGDILEFGG